MTSHIVTHHPIYCVARGRCWAYCICGNWVTNPKINGNLMWAQLEFGRHLVAARAEREL